MNNYTPHIYSMLGEIYGKSKLIFVLNEKIDNAGTLRGWVDCFLVLFLIETYKSINNIVK
jgi:hypothetical protein